MCGCEWDQYKRREAVPDGYVLVPVEPTPKMIDAALRMVEPSKLPFDSAGPMMGRVLVAALAAAKEKR